MYAKGSLSTHMTELLKTQSDMIERHKQIIKKVDINHTLKTASAKYTVFDTGSNVFFEPTTGKPKDRLHSRKLGPFLVLDHEDNTYNLQNLVSKKKFKVNIIRIHPFHFEKQRVNPQEAAAHYSDEFIVASILSHTGDFKSTLSFQVHWLDYTPAEDTGEPLKNVMHVEKLQTYLRSIGLENMVPKYSKVIRTEA